MSMYDFLKDFAGPIATTIAAAVAATVTSTFAVRQTRAVEQQARTARNKLKIETFELRYAAYRAAIDVAEAALHDVIFDEQTRGEWEVNCSRALESEFLFSEDKYEAIKRTVGISRSLRYQTRRYEKFEGDDKEKGVRAQKLDATERELRSLYKSLPTLFRKELALEFVDQP